MYERIVKRAREDQCQNQIHEERPDGTYCSYSIKVKLHFEPAPIVAIPLQLTAFGLVRCLNV
jgi:hypothetical protein